MSQIHPTAVLTGDVQIAEDVTLGPYVVVQGPVTIGSGTAVEAHTRLEGPLVIGRDNRISQFCSIGAPPQDLKFQGEPTRLEIGDRNWIREFTSIHRGTVGGGGLTSIGSDCLLMAYSHVAHDCRIEDHVIFANGATLAGHVTVGYRSTVGAFTGVHQFCRVGPYAFIGGYSVITRDALPFIKTVGERNHAGIYGINTIGLQRLGFAKERIEALQKAYRLLFRSTSNLKKGLENLRQQLPVEGDVKILVEFIDSSHRGVIR
jgi:UDP-N-acetylglucosamine acyltransferase